MNIFQIIFNWLSISNRWKHLFGGIAVGFVLTILCVIGVASGMEFKDKAYGNSWDWTDWWCTIFGGIIGQGLQLLLISLFL